MHPEAVAALRAYDWPGNVRELENLMHREFLLADGEELRLPSLPRSAGLDRRRAPRSSTRRKQDSRSRASAAASTAWAFREAKARAIADFEREYVRDLLQQSGGNVSLAARLAGKERSRFNRLVRKYQLSAREFRAASAIPR